MSAWFSPLLFLLAGSSEDELRQQVEFLKAENELLRKRVPKKRIFLTVEEKQRLLKIGETIGPGVLKLITIVHPRTYQRWLQQSKSGEPGKKPMGRPRTLETVRKIVIKLATETGWGYRRILGELRKLSIHSVSESTIRNILAEAGVQPSPKRGKGTWSEFMKLHAETLWQVDFFTKPVVTPTGVRQAFVLVLLHIKSRRVFCSPSTLKPNAPWMVSQAERILEHARSTGLPIGQVIRDRDAKYGTDFKQVFVDAGVTVIPTAPRAPNQNAYVERFIGSIKHEMLNRFICFGQKHLDYLVSEFADYYNQLRPHQGVGNRPLQGDWPVVDKPPGDDEQLVCHTKLGGVLKHYDPQQFLDYAVSGIRRTLNQMIVEGIKYEKVNGQVYEMLLFEEKEIESYTSRMIDVENGIYDCVEWESEIEREFAEAMSSREDIKLVIKLPGWFKVETPIGTYNPDWAIVKQEDDKLYLVRETKSTKEQEKLRQSEWDKIQCGKAHFEALDVDFDHITSAQEV